MMAINSLANWIYQINKVNQDELKDTMKGVATALHTVRQSEKERERITQDVNSANAYTESIDYTGPKLEINPATGQPNIDPNTYINIARNTAETEAGKQALIIKYGKDYAPLLENVKNPYALKPAEESITKQREKDLFIQSAIEYGYTPDKLGYKDDWSDLDVDKAKVKLASMEKDYNITQPLSGITHGQGKKARAEYDKWLTANPKATYIEKITKRDEIRQTFEDIASSIAFNSTKPKIETDKSVWAALSDKGVKQTVAIFRDQSSKQWTLNVKNDNGTWKVQPDPNKKNYWITVAEAEKRGINYEQLPDKNTDEFDNVNVSAPTKAATKPTPAQNKTPNIETNDFTIDKNGKKVFK